MVHKKASSISASPALDFLPLPKRTNLNTLSRNYPRDQRKNTVQPIMDCTVFSKLPYAEPPMGFLLQKQVKTSRLRRLIQDCDYGTIKLSFGICKHETIEHS